MLTEQMPTSTTSPRLLIPRPVLASMLAQAVAERPNECCGILGGVAVDGGRLLRVQTWHPLVNAAASPTEYESEPRSMFQAMRDLRQAGLDVVAVYHSHPTSAAVPSRTDLARNYSEQVVNLIISLQNAQPEVRGWWLAATGYREADWAVVDDEPGGG
jgi:[CysO sulfur-carrier protein]-S-L-cysteine hydrolase